MTVTKNLNPVNGPRKQCAIVSYVDSDLIADTAVRRSVCRRVATFGSSMQLEGTTLAYWARGGEREWRIFWACLLYTSDAADE